MTRPLFPLPLAAPDVLAWVDHVIPVQDIQTELKLNPPTSDTIVIPFPQPAKQPERKAA